MENAVSKENESSEIVSGFERHLSELRETVNDVYAFRNRVKGQPPEPPSTGGAIKGSPVKQETLDMRLRDLSEGFAYQINRLNEVLSSLKNWA